ncbi:MAG: YdeI/OmpD-associated family protein [Actinomycetota bacterium]|nr:YdeI/OmpD-associated family protein [Actinomycetota bacterium]
MGSRHGGTPERPALFFDGPDDFRAWLEEHHERATGLWMGLRKKHVTDRGLTWAQAVPQALCYGWIDSQVQRIDDEAVRQRWTPRKPTSTWSSVNLAFVEQLSAQGLMRPAGIAAWELRRAERSGIYSYEQGELTLPDPYAAQLAADPAALAFWVEATAGYRKTAASWVSSARTAATNDRRMAQLVSDSAAGRLIPSQRYGTRPAWVARAAAAAAAAAGEDGG